MMIQVALYKGRKRLFNRVVSWWMRGSYSHCEAIVNWLPSGEAVCWSSSFMDKGIRTKTMLLTSENWDIVDVPGIDPVEVARWFWQREGHQYDWLGMIGCAIRIIPHRKGRWFCSSAVSEAIGIPDPWRVEPCQLASILRYNAASTNQLQPS